MSFTYEKLWDTKKFVLHATIFKHAIAPMEEQPYTTNSVEPSPS
jgi:hypothetical protein